MARFNTVMIETGTTTVADAGTATITLDSPFTGNPTINAIAGPIGSTADVGSANLPSFNANTFITGISKAAGAWSFTINTEALNEHVTQSGPMQAADGVFTNIQIIWRAIGPVSAT